MRPKIKLKGRRVYVYPVDKAGRTVDFYLSKHRDMNSTKRFFRGAILRHGPPQKITLNG